MPQKGQNENILKYGILKKANNCAGGGTELLLETAESQ